MNPPQTPLDVVKHLTDLTQRLYTQVNILADAETEAVKLRQAADAAEANAYMRAVGPVESRKRQALIDTDAQETAAAVAEALVRITKTRIRALETDIDVHRTFGATLRAELQTLGAVS